YQAGPDPFWDVPGAPGLPLGQYLHLPAAADDLGSRKVHRGRQLVLSAAQQGQPRAPARTDTARLPTLWLIPASRARADLTKRVGHALPAVAGASVGAAQARRSSTPAVDRDLGCGGPGRGTAAANARLPGRLYCRQGPARSDPHRPEPDAPPYKGPRTLSRRCHERYQIGREVGT